MDWQILLEAEAEAGKMPALQGDRQKLRHPF